MAFSTRGLFGSSKLFRSFLDPFSSLGELQGKGFEETAAKIHAVEASDCRSTALHRSKASRPTKLSPSFLDLATACQKLRRAPAAPLAFC